MKGSDLKKLENKVKKKKETGNFHQCLQPARGIFKITFQMKYEHKQYIHLVLTNPRES